MKFFKSSKESSSKSTTRESTKNPVFRNILNDLACSCSHSNDDDNEDFESSISYMSMSEQNFDIPKICMRKQFAQTNLSQQRFLCESSFDTVDSCAEKRRSESYNASSTPILSTASNSPALAFSNANYNDFSPVESPSSFIRSDLKTESSRPVNYGELLFQSFDEGNTSTSSASSVSTDSVDEITYNDQMICWVNYIARSPQEIDLNFSQRVNLLHISSDWCFVRNLATLQCGYVPTGVLMKIEPFLTQLLEITQDDVFV